MNLYTHLNFGGNCEEAFRFYEKHLGGKITMIMRKDDLPPGTSPLRHPMFGLLMRSMSGSGKHDWSPYVPLPGV